MKLNFLIGALALATAAVSAPTAAPESASTSAAASVSTAATATGTPIDLKRLNSGLRAALSKYLVEHTASASISATPTTTATPTATPTATTPCKKLGFGAAKASIIKAAIHKIMQETTVPASVSATTSGTATATSTRAADANDLLSLLKAAQTPTPNDKRDARRRHHGRPKQTSHSADYSTTTAIATETETETTTEIHKRDVAMHGPASVQREGATLTDPRLTSAPVTATSSQTQATKGSAQSAQSAKATAASATSAAASTDKAEDQPQATQTLEVLAEYNGFKVLGNPVPAQETKSGEQHTSQSSQSSQTSQTSQTQITRAPIASYTDNPVFKTTRSVPQTTYGHDAIERRDAHPLNLEEIRNIAGKLARHKAHHSRPAAKHTHKVVLTDSKPKTLLVKVKKGKHTKAASHATATHRAKERRTAAAEHVAAKTPTPSSVDGKNAEANKADGYKTILKTGDQKENPDRKIGGAAMADPV